MKNVTELRNDLIDVYEKTKSGALDFRVARALASEGLVIIKSAALELQYNQFTKQSDKKIKFLEG